MSQSCPRAVPESSQRITNFLNEFKILSLMRHEDAIKNAFSKIKDDLAKQNDIINRLIDKIGVLEDENRHLRDILGSVKEKKKEDPIKKEILNQIGQNKKKFIMNQMVDYIKLGNMTLSRLKQIFVEEKKYCSKSTFYRYLKEMENLIVVIKKNNISYLMLKSQISTVSH